jgi:di/tricarboxylate transporter
VISVACVLVLSRGLQNTGAVDALSRRLLPAKAGPSLSILALAALAALLSAFMNNVGALALLMPVAVQMARRLELSPGQLLMPLAFGSILGGMTTLIGTPPNLIVSGFRAEQGAGAFGMFDFSAVGVAVALAGLALIGLGGWRLVPRRSDGADAGFESGTYLTEARIGEDSRSDGKRLRELEAALEDIDAQIVGLIRNELRVIAPHPGRRVRAGDILVIEAEAEALAGALSALELKLEEAKPTGNEEAAESSNSDDAAAKAQRGEDDEHETSSERAATRSDEIVLVELAVLPGASIVGRSPSELLLRSRHGLNLLALSRQGRRSQARLRSVRFSSGDLLLVQGSPEAISGFAAEAGCVPLAERELRIPDRRQALTAAGILLASVAAAGFGLLPAAVAFAAGALASLALRTVPARAVYQAIDWPVIVLLGALIPVAGAMESTGAADLIATLLLEDVARGQPVLALALIMVVTMTLSDLMNNAATAAVMCPIALGTAAALGVSADAFLMAVAIGASCAFLTPIGHQNNTLILGPGGFRFGDYWPLGLCIEVAVVAVSLPLLLWVWPL